MSKGGSGDEFELKPVDEQAETEARAEQPLAEELDISFEPIAEPPAQPAETAPEPMGVASPVGQPPGEAEISAEQFVGTADQPPEAEALAFVKKGETELVFEQPEQAAAKGPEGLEEFRPEEEKPPEEQEPEKEAQVEDEEKEEARPSIFARIAEASPYTVLLCAAFLALVIGVIFLLLELKTYDFDIRAKKARQGALDRPAAASSCHTPIV